MLSSVEKEDRASEPTVNRLDAIQHLRFIAAALVLIGHCLHEATDRLDLQADFPFDWGIGVDIFFIVSGFVMLLTSHEKFGRRDEALKFIRRRVERVVPLYWIFTTLMISAILIFPYQIDNADIDLPYIVSSYAFFPFPRADGALRPVLALGWTLNYEMFFYVMFAAAMLLPRRIGLPTLVSVLAAGSAANLLNGGFGGVWGFWTNPIVMEFVAGMGLAKLFLANVRIEQRVALCLMIMGTVWAVLCKDVTGIRLVDAGVAATVFTTGWLLGPTVVRSGKVSRWLNVGGDASYALYLTHPFSLNLVVIAWVWLGLGHPWIFFSVACVVSVIGALLAFWVIERPLLDWFKRRGAKAAMLAA